MTNIQLKSSVFSSFMVFWKILGRSIDPLDPPLTGPLILNTKYENCHRFQILFYYKLMWSPLGHIDRWMYMQFPTTPNTYQTTFIQRYVRRDRRGS